MGFAASCAKGLSAVGGLAGYSLAGGIGQSYAVVEGGGSGDLGSLVGWAVSLARGRK